VTWQGLKAIRLE